MPSMLEQAIIDAKQLREAAQKNAEETVVEKYQSEIKQAVDKILEQEDLALGADMGMGSPDEMGMGADMGMGAGATPESAKQPEPGTQQIEDIFQQLPFLQTADDDDVVQLNLDKLEEALDEKLKKVLQESEDLEEVELDEDLEALIDEEYDLEEDLDFMLDEEEDLEEDKTITLSDEVSAAIANALGQAKGDGGFATTAESINLDKDLLEALLSEDDDAVVAGKTSGDPKKGQSIPGLGKQPRGLSKVQFKGVPKRAPVDTCPKGKEAKKDAKGKIILDKDGKVTCVSKKPWEKKKPPRTGPAKTDESVSRKNDTLLTEQKNMNTKLSLLEGKLDKYTTVITELKNRLEESGLDNAKLLYQNRVLDSVSLNERQKDKIVEAIKGAKSVEEAKIIFETLQSTVGTSSNTSTKVPDSLNEVVYRGSSAFMPLREEKQKVSDPFVARMKALAGLKKD